jgi:stearoyl-CoA 9-desaturase NADPH oxidoreductase
VLPEPLPDRLLFLTAGSGVTPVAATLHSLAAQDRMPDVVLALSAPALEEVVFGPYLRTLAARWKSLRLYERHIRTGGRITMAQVRDICPDWRERQTWACGPAGMLDDAQRHWRRAGVGDRLRRSISGPRRCPAVPAAGSGSSRADTRLTRTAAHRCWPSASTPVCSCPGGCRLGVCHSCVVRLRSGRVRDLRTGREHGDKGELIQTCVTAAAGPVEIDV